MQTQAIRTYRQEKPLITSEKGNADERENVLVRGQVWNQRNKLNSVVSSNLEVVCRW